MKIRHNGTLYTLPELIELVGVTPHKSLTERTIRDRIAYKGWDAREAMTTPRMSHRQVSRLGARASGWRNFVI